MSLSYWSNHIQSNMTIQINMNCTLSRVRWWVRICVMYFCLSTTVFVCDCVNVCRCVLLIYSMFCKRRLHNCRVTCTCICLKIVFIPT